MEDLQKVGENMGIREHKQIIEKVQETVSHWHETAKDCGVKPEHADFIGKTCSCSAGNCIPSNAGHCQRTRAGFHEGYAE